MNITTSGNLGYGSYPSVQFKDNLRGQGKVSDFLKKHGKKIGTAIGGVALGALASHLGAREAGIVNPPVRDLDQEARQRRATLMRRRQERINKEGGGKKRGRPRKK